jgi:transcriptional regulator with XRE-family HTH domain
VSNSEFEDSSHPDVDAVIGANLARWREQAHLTQAEVANEATARGLPMRQQTIAKIERGSRPLRLAEADVLARVLQANLESLVMPEGESRKRQQVIARTVMMERDVTELRRRASLFLGRQRLLRDHLEEDPAAYADRDLGPRVVRLLNTTPAAIVGDVAPTTNAELAAVRHDDQQTQR